MQSATQSWAVRTYEMSSWMSIIIFLIDSLLVLGAELLAFNRHSHKDSMCSMTENFLRHATTYFE